MWNHNIHGNKEGNVARIGNSMGETSKEEMKDNKGADLLRDGYLWRVEDDLLERYEDIGRALIAEIEIYRLSWLVLIIENVSVFFSPSWPFNSVLRYSEA